MTEHVRPLWQIGCLALLDDVLKSRLWEVMKATRGVTVDNLWEMAPMTFPMTNRDPELPMIAQFPIDEWTRAGEPCLTAKGWCKLCIRLYQNNKPGLRCVFEVARRELGAEALGEEIEHILRHEPATYFTPVMWPGAAGASSGLGTEGRSHPPTLVPWNWDSERDDFEVVEV